MVWENQSQECNTFYNSWRRIFQRRKATVWRGKERKGQLKRTFLNFQGQHGVLTPISIKSLVVSEARHGRVEGENNFNSMKIKINDFTSKEVIFFHVFCLSLNNHEPALRLKQSQNQIQKKRDFDWRESNYFDYYGISLFRTFFTS